MEQASVRVAYDVSVRRVLLDPERAAAGGCKCTGPESRRFESDDLTVGEAGDHSSLPVYQNVFGAGSPGGPQLGRRQPVVLLEIPHEADV